MIKHIRHSPSLSYSDATRKSGTTILSISRRCWRRPPSGGTQKTVVPDGMEYTVTAKVRVHINHPPTRLTSSDIGFPADGDPTPSAKSCSTGPSHVWHGMNPMCDMTYTGMEGAMYMDGSPGEHQLNVTVTGPSAETSWGDNAVFEPYIASYQSASAQYPDAACMLGFPEYIGGSSLNTVVQGHSDEVSCHVCSSYSSARMLMVSRIRSHLRPAMFNNHQILWPIRSRVRKEKRTRTSQHANERSPRRTCTAASASAWNPSKTHTCARSTVRLTLTRVGAARARAGSSR